MVSIFHASSTPLKTVISLISLSAEFLSSLYTNLIPFCFDQFPFHFSQSLAKNLFLCSLISYLSASRAARFGYLQIWRSSLPSLFYCMVLGCSLLTWTWVAGRRIMRTTHCFCMCHLRMLSLSISKLSLCWVLWMQLLPSFLIHHFLKSQTRNIREVMALG